MSNSFILSGSASFMLSIMIATNYSLWFGFLCFFIFIAVSFFGLWLFNTTISRMKNLKRRLKYATTLNSAAARLLKKGATPLSIRRMTIYMVSVSLNQEWGIKFIIASKENPKISKTMKNLITALSSADEKTKRDFAICTIAFALTISHNSFFIGGIARKYILSDFACLHPSDHFHIDYKNEQVGDILNRIASLHTINNK